MVRIKKKKGMISIIIPFYNEEGNAPILYQNLEAVLPVPGYDYEVLMVNDGSRDNTLQELFEIAEINKKYKVVNFRRNYGQTAAMMAGIDFSIGDVIIPMDGDLQNDPKDIPNLIKKIEEGYDVCSGWRKNRKDAKIRRNLPSRIANWLISRISGVSLHDYGCTLKAYKKEVIKDVRLYGEMHRFIPIYAVWNGARITEIPVTHHPRIHGKSKYGLNRTIKVILDLIVVKFLADYSQKPIYLFGGIGLVSFALGFLIFIFMVYLRIVESIHFNRTPLPELIVILYVMGAQSVFMGLIAEILMRTYYESQGKSVYIVADKKNL